MADIRTPISQYAASFWARRWTILGAAWLVCAVGWVAVALLPDRYTSKARLYVDTETILGPLMKGLAVTPDVERQLEMMRQTLLSRPNLEELIRLSGLDLTVDSEIVRANLVDELAETIDLELKGRNLFELSYEHTDPDTAYRVVDSILQIFVEQNLGLSQRDVEAARQFIEKRIDEYEKKLRDAELRVAEFRREHAEELGGVDRNLRGLEHTESELRRLEAELQSATWRRDQLSLQLASTPRFLSGAEAEGRLLSPAEARLHALRQQLAGRLLVYTERHPDVVALKALITEAEREVGAAGGGGGPTAGGGVPNPAYQQLESELRSLELVIEDVKRRIELTQDRIQNLSRRVSDVPQVEADLTRLTRDYNVLLEQYEGMIQRREAAQLATRLEYDTRSVEFRVVDPPSVPLQPSGPPRGLLMAGVLFVGLGAGFAAALARTLLSGAFHSASELRHAFGLPVLGSIAVAPVAGRRLLRTLGHVNLALGALGLFAACGLLAHIYETSPARPEPMEVARGVKDRVEAGLLSAGSIIDLALATAAPEPAEPPAAPVSSRATSAPERSPGDGATALDLEAVAAALMDDDWVAAAPGRRGAPAGGAGVTLGRAAEDGRRSAAEEPPAAAQPGYRF